MPRRKRSDQPNPPCLSQADLGRRLDTQHYERHLIQAQRRLREVQLAYF